MTSSDDHQPRDLRPHRFGGLDADPGGRLVMYTDLEKKLRAECEYGMIVGPKGHTARAANGQPFVELANYGKPAASAQEALSAVLKRFKAYANGRMIYWLIPPEIRQSSSGWTAYMRVAVI